MEMFKDNDCIHSKEEMDKKIALHKKMVEIKDKVWKDGIIAYDIITEIKRKLPYRAVKYISDNTMIDYNKCLAVVNYKRNSIDKDSISIISLAMYIIIMEIDITNKPTITKSQHYVKRIF